MRGPAEVHRPALRALCTLADLTHGLAKRQDVAWHEGLCSEGSDSWSQARLVTFPSPRASKAGVPNFWAVDGYLLSGQRQYQIRNKVHSKCNGLESSQKHAPLLPSEKGMVRGKTVFHETGPWWQKGWGLPL